MKKKNGNRKMVMLMSNDIKVFGCCPECGETVTDEMYGVYVDNEGRYYCCLDCALSYNGITELEF